MGIIFGALKRFFFWSYERGSWQYDVLCGLILAFIFFGPNQIFHSADGETSAPRRVAVQEVGLLEPHEYEEKISEYLSRKDNRKVRATSIEPLFDSDGKLKIYLVNEIKQ